MSRQINEDKGNNSADFPHTSLYEAKRPTTFYASITNSDNSFLQKNKSHLSAMMKKIPSNNRPEIAACGQKKTGTSHLGKVWGG